MGFVNVPVPEEHVFEVMRFIARVATRAELEEWDEQAVEKLFLDADEVLRSLLSAVARATVAEKPAVDEDIASVLELKVRDLNNIVMVVGAAAQQDNKVPLVQFRTDEELNAAGQTVRMRKLVMTPEVAQMVRAAEKKAREIEPHPLEGRTT